MTVWGGLNPSICLFVCPFSIPAASGDQGHGVCWRPMPVHCRVTQKDKQRLETKFDSVSWSKSPSKTKSTSCVSCADFVFSCWCKLGSCFKEYDIWPRLSMQILRFSCLLRLQECPFNVQTSAGITFRLASTETLVRWVCGSVTLERPPMCMTEIAPWLLLLWECKTTRAVISCKGELQHCEMDRVLIGAGRAQN